SSASGMTSGTSACTPARRRARRPRRSARRPSHSGGTSSRRTGPPTRRHPRAARAQLFVAGAPPVLEPSATERYVNPTFPSLPSSFRNCLKRSLEAQAFSGREIGGDDDVLDFLVGHFVDVDLTRQPAS